ncbi:hypothetical protein A1O3_02239 [Capronia epimyces CBS 606.96]|uniref:Uncharacterized protein n=1 Tax=Capronia epimyces CBS 606.96 TaxID=1182542 RepID=W9YHM5_9EURO|nr:uncharacterized protein A1O3_02239 [Capronia epimyces CBS 606.96]EXJ89175.1 hypothetical protein A1O3_02239 [Capronia epimyces CBS 606.96]
MEQEEIEEWINYLEKPIGDYLWYELDLPRDQHWKIWAAIYLPISGYLMYSILRFGSRVLDDPEGYFVGIINSTVNGLCWFATSLWAIVKGVFARTILVGYHRWCQGPWRGLCNGIEEAVARLPAPEPGFVPGGFQQDINEQEFRVLTELRANDLKARDAAEEKNARLVTELGNLRAAVASLEKKLEEANKRAEQADKRADEAEYNQISWAVAPRRQKARPGRLPFEEILSAPSSPDADEVVTPTILGRLRRLEKEAEEKDAEVDDLLEELAEARKTAVAVTVPVPMPVVVDTTEVGVQTEDLPLPEKEVEVFSPVYADQEVQTDLPLPEEVSPVAEKAAAYVDTTDAGVQTDPVPVPAPAPAPVPVPSPVAATATIEYQMLEEELEAAKAAQESRDAEARSLKAGQEELDSKIQSMTGELATAQNAIAAISQELTESRARFGSLEYAYNQTAATLGACDQARQEAVARVAELQAVNNQGNAELAQQREAVAELQKSLEAATQSQLQLEESFQTGRQQFEAERLQFDELKRKHDEEVAEKVAQASHEEKLVVAGRQLEAENNALKMRVDALEWSGKKLAGELRDAQAASATKDEEIRRLREQAGQTGAGAMDVDKSSKNVLAAAALPQTPAGKAMGSSPSSRASSAGGATPKLGESPLISRPRPSPISRGVIETYQHVIDDLTRKNKALVEEKARVEESEKGLREARDGLEVELALLKELHEEDELEAQAEMRAQLNKHRAELGDMEWQLRTKEIDLTVASNKMEVARIQYEAEKRAVEELRGQVGPGQGQGSAGRDQHSPRKGKRVASESSLVLKEAKKPMVEEKGEEAERDAQWALVVAAEEEEEEEVSEEE